MKINSKTRLIAKSRNALANMDQSLIAIKELIETVIEQDQGNMPNLETLEDYLNDCSICFEDCQSAIDECAGAISEVEDNLDNAMSTLSDAKVYLLEVKQQFDGEEQII